MKEIVKIDKPGAVSSRAVPGENGFFRNVPRKKLPRTKTFRRLPDTLNVSIGVSKKIFLPSIRTCAYLNRCKNQTRKSVTTE